MSNNLQNLLREALLNNSYDYSSMHNVLRMAWENSYSYLYNLQKNYVEFEDLEYISNDTDKSVKRIGRLYNDKLLRACFDIEYDFIHVCDREEFHNSSFYFNEFTFYDMINNPNIFKKMPIIIIDGQCMWDYKLRVNKKSITVILPFKRDFVISNNRNPDTDELVYLDHNIRVLVIDNIYYSEFEMENINLEDMNQYNNSYGYCYDLDIPYKFFNIHKNETKVEHKLTIDVSNILEQYDIDIESGLFTICISKNVNNKKNLNNFISSNIIISLYIPEIEDLTPPVAGSSGNNVSNTKAHYYPDLPKRYECHFVLGEELYQNLIDENSNYRIHLFFINKLHNYTLPMYRHGPNNLEPWYINIINSTQYDYYYDDSDYTHYSQTITKDIVCDNNGECNVFMIQRQNSQYHQNPEFNYYGDRMSDVYKAYSMPIPVEDLIVIKFDSDNNPTLMRNTETVKLYYPNIYRIIDPDRKPGDRYNVSYFYHDATYLEYIPVHEYFFRFLEVKFKLPIECIIDFMYRDVNIPYSLLSELSDEEAEELKITFNKILNYQYYNHQYCEVDFVKRYILEPNNSDKEVIEYKDETLKKWINESDQFLLRDYVLEQDKLYSSVYHLWTNTLNLSYRLRTNTREESKYMIQAYRDTTDWNYFTKSGKRYDQDGNYIGLFTDSQLREKLNSWRTYKTLHNIMVTDGWYDLNGEYYVFAFRNNETVKNNLLNTSVFVDGLHVDNIIQERYKFTDYFYIPKDLVTNDSYIEIEVFPTYKYGAYVKFESLDDRKNITLLEPADQIFPTAQDLFYMEPSSHFINKIYSEKTLSRDSKGNKDTIELSSKLSTDQAISITTNRIYPDSTIYSNDFFEITAKYNDGDFTVKTVDPNKPVKFTRLSTFEIKPLYETVLNKDLYVGISKVPRYISYRLEYGGYPYLALNENEFKFNIEYLRIFINGRLLPRQRYCFYPSYIYPRIQFLDHMNTGDIINIEITPYRYKEIYYQKDLQPGETLIDLKDVITKPFDIRYYDVYMNGRKLGLNSVWTISPWQITLTNLKSLHNLQIFEKERDWEYFGVNYNDHSYYYTIEDLFNTSFINEEEKNIIIAEMIDEAKEPPCIIRPPVDEEDLLDFSDDDKKYSQVNEFYFNELIPKTFVVPDTKQFDDDIMKDYYTIIDDSFRVHPVDYYRSEDEKERRKNYVDALSLDPDLYIEGENGHENGLVYFVGHPEDVEDELLLDKPKNMYEKEVIDNAN